jgi:hypothetical protein
VKQAALFLAIPILLAFSTPTVVIWSAAPVKASSRAPGQATIHVRGDIINRWHIYSVSQKPGGPKALSFELEPNKIFSLGAVTAPKPRVAYDAEFNMKTETYSGAPDFTIPIRWTRPLPAGTSELRLIVRYQACSDKQCLPPRKEALAVQLKSPGAK